MMNKEELDKIQDSLKKRGLIDEETLSCIDRELLQFLEEKLERNIVLIKDLLNEKKSLDENDLLWLFS